MRFLNLALAMAERHYTGTMLADLLKISEATFSRKIHGRAQFAPHERARIAASLRFDPRWLFEEPIIPASARRETTMLKGPTETR
jgi:hypothetical protein